MNTKKQVVCLIPIPHRQVGHSKLNEFELYEYSSGAIFNFNFIRGTWDCLNGTAKSGIIGLPTPQLTSLSHYDTALIIVARPGISRLFHFTVALGHFGGPQKAIAFEMWSKCESLVIIQWPALDPQLAAALLSLICI